jgi:excisionase family DNA binding protein
MSSTIDTRKLISVQAAAVYTGLSVHTIYAMVSQRRIPHIKLGRRVKFDGPLLDAWIRKNTVMPMPARGA